MIPPFRLELSFKDIDQLKRKIEFCNENNIYRINIPCKGLIKKSFLLEVVDYLGIYQKKLDVIYHYSLFHQYSKNKKESYKYLLDFFKKCSSYDNSEILLISGTNKKKNFDTVTVLNDLKFNSNFGMKIGIAFNPYFFESNDVQIERNLFIDKINTGLINSIWLQFGSDLNSLQKEIFFIKKSLKKYSLDLKIYGSLFIPSKQFLARFKFRPWRGVYLSEDFLNSVEYSTDLTREIFKCYSNNNIFPLIETECINLNQLNSVYQLIK